MIPLLGLWLCCIHLTTSQEMCSFPGELPAPEIFLRKLSRQEGDTVVIKCNIPSLFRFTRVIFCKDGVEIAVLPMQEKQYAYDFNYKVSTDSSEELSCMYQYKNENNQVNNSRLSAPQYLTDFKGFSASYGFVLILVFGITILSVLVLLLVGYILEKTGIIKCRNTREQDPEDIYWDADYQPNSGMEHFLSFATTSWAILTQNGFHMYRDQDGPSVGYFHNPEQEGKEMVRTIYANLDSTAQEGESYSTLHTKEKGEGELCSSSLSISSINCN
ncbi:hypothetical protein KIL84_001648 [Mauremys mutica]|uniref:Uncharacterized protein n=1 Tax=Mauremys mutica TaxID=74926 RepID=A0A9D3XFS1_9SAUR|nr:hypothetical protein KIL84_001648 [Mauremys mutica]